MKNQLLLIMTFSIISVDMVKGSSFAKAYGPGWQNTLSTPGINKNFLGTNPSTYPLASTFSKAISSTHTPLKSNLGSTASTFAPSLMENLLNQMIRKLEDIRSRMQKFRQEDYSTFMKYFNLDEINYSVYDKTKAE